MKVFVSSLITGYEHFRTAAAGAAENLGHQVLRAEDFVASPTSPQQACLAAVRDADVVLLLVGERYGAVQPSGLSATHEEYREARDRKPVLVFVENCATREAAEEAFRTEVQEWETGHVRVAYTSPDELRSAVVRALHDFELAHAAGPVDASEMLERARALLPSRGGLGSIPLLAVAVAGGPNQQVVRPAELGAADLVRDLQRDAMFGANSILDTTEGTTSSIDGVALVLQQRAGAVLVDQAGSVLITQPALAQTSNPVGMLRAIIEEELVAAVARALRFAGQTLDRIDPLGRISDVVVVVALLGAGSIPIRTRAENAASPNSMPMGAGGDETVVTLTPPRRHRQALVHDADRIAEDLTVLLTRRRRS